jgi:formate hydrogenlyase subunit 4
MFGGPIVSNMLHVLTVVLLPPLLLGVINKTKAWFAGRSGPPLTQPYRDLCKLVQKQSVFSTSTTWLFRFGPVVGLATSLVAALILPLGHPSSPISFTGDLMLFVYVLGLGRFFGMLAALDTGSAFEGMGAAREATYACLAEPALFFGSSETDRHAADGGFAWRFAHSGVVRRRGLDCVDPRQLDDRAPGRKLPDPV